MTVTEVASVGTGYAVAEKAVVTDSGKMVTVDTATVSVLTMLITVVPNAMVGAGAPTVMKTVSGAQVAVALEEERSQYLLNWPNGWLRMAQRLCKNDQVDHFKRTYSWGRATASGSEARATREPNDVLIRILLVVTAQDGSDDEEEWSRESRLKHTKNERPSRQGGFEGRSQTSHNGETNDNGRCHHRVCVEMKR